MVQYVLSGTAGTRQKENSEQAAKLDHNAYRKMLSRFQCDAHNLIPEGEKQSALCCVISSLFLFGGTEFIPRK